MPCRASRHRLRARHSRHAKIAERLVCMCPPAQLQYLSLRMHEDHDLSVRHHAFAAFVSHVSECAVIVCADERSQFSRRNLLGVAAAALLSVPLSAHISEPRAWAADLSPASAVSVTGPRYLDTAAQAAVDTALRKAMDKPKVTHQRERLGCKLASSSTLYAVTRASVLARIDRAAHAAACEHTDCCALPVQDPYASAFH